MTTSDAQADAIVIGACHNGLTFPACEERSRTIL